MLFNMDEKQLIIYGAPGTGKSFQIDSALKAYGFSKIVRVVFHKEYTYSDFIGYVSPQSTEEHDIDYAFKDGPFTHALELAFESSEPVCLLIEELNRGNASAIFGDVFQLLDRTETGISSYTVSNRDIREHINANQEAAKRIKKFAIGVNDILIPDNLYIVATMNTADQNVFTVDSAFKRRFTMRYMPIVFDATEPHLKRMDEISKVNVFDEKHTWSEFAQMVNATIDEVNQEIVSISEDKKIGPYFVDEIDISCKQSFCDKVILYLKNDVFKYSDGILIESYEEIYDSFVDKSEDIFEIFKKDEEA